MGTALISLPQIEARIPQLNAEYLKAQGRIEGDFNLKRGILLCAAKPQVKHGEWSKWVKQHWAFTIDHASKLMRIAEAETAEAQAKNAAPQKPISKSVLQGKPPTLQERAKAATRALGTAQRTNKADFVQARKSAPAEMTAYAAFKIMGIDLEQQSITAESLTILFRGLAAKHHPDRGGDAAQMAVLNRANDLLKE